MLGLPEVNMNVNVVEFGLIQTGTYQEQYYRPFVVNNTAENINSLRETTHDGNVINLSDLERISSEIIQPKSTTDGLAHVPHGWEFRRFCFIMRVIEEGKINTGTTTERIFYGYTDHSDASFNHLDPKMRIYFNSELTVNTIMRPAPNGMMIPMSRVMSASQIVQPSDMMGINSGYGQGGNQVFLLRPEDTFYHAHNSAVVDALQSSNVINGKVSEIFDDRHVSAQGGHYRLNRRQDNSASRYMKRTLDGYGKAVKETMMLNDGIIDNDLLYTNAANEVRTQNIATIDFFNILKRECGYLEQGYVTYGDLCSVFPGLDPLTQVTMDDGRSIRQMGSSNESEVWNGGESWDIAVSMLAQVIPSIMMENYIRQIDFTVNPGNGYGEYIIDVDKSRVRLVSDNLPESEQIKRIQEFKRRLTVDVLNSITKNNQIFCRIAMNTNIQAESVIMIDYDNQPTRRYVAPTFSDGLFTPVATLQFDHRKKICNDLTWMLSQSFENSVNTASLGYEQNQFNPQSQSFDSPNIVRNPNPNPNQTYQSPLSNDFSHLTDYL